MNNTTQQNISGTKEWAVANINIAKGCENDCKYCYAKGNSIRFKRSTKDSWKTPEFNQKTINAKVKKVDGKIMFPTSHDITPFNLSESIELMEKNLLIGNKMLIVSKPRLDCIKIICDKLVDCKDQILFRFTIGSANNEVLKFWEPGASSFEERLASLKYAYENGYQTSISSEPMLDDNIDKVIDAVTPYVTDSIWLGKVNRLKSILGVNKENDKITIQKAEELINSQNDEAIKELYEKHKDNKLIKWKESIKKVIGIKLNEEAGLDV